MLYCNMSPETQKYYFTQQGGGWWVCVCVGGGDPILNVSTKYCGDVFFWLRGESRDFNHETSQREIWICREGNRKGYAKSLDDFRAGRLNYNFKYEGFQSRDLSMGHTILCSLKNLQENLGLALSGRWPFPAA